MAIVEKFQSVAGQARQRIRPPALANRVIGATRAIGAQGIGAPGIGAPGLVIERAGRTSRIDLRVGRQTVGGSAECDIVTIGSGTGPIFSIDIQRNGLSHRADLVCLREGLQMAGQLLADGAVVSLPEASAQGEAVLTYGETVFRLQGLRAGPQRWDRRRMVAAGLFGLASLLLLVGLSGFGSEEPGAAVAVSQPRSEITPVDVLVREMRDALRLSGLRLDVDHRPELNEVQIGQPDQPLTYGEKNKLGSLIDAFSRRSALPLRDVTRLSSGMEGFVASVALSPAKFLVGSDGRRYREGDVLPDNWRVDAIEPGVVTVSRDAKTDRIVMTTTTIPMTLRLAQKTEGQRP